MSKKGNVEEDRQSLIDLFKACHHGRFDEVQKAVKKVTAAHSQAAKQSEGTDPSDGKIQNVASKGKTAVVGEIDDDDLNSLLEFKDGEGKGAAHFAAHGGNVEVLKGLLARWPQLSDELTADGETPLMLAASGGHARCCTAILAAAGKRARPDDGSHPAVELIRCRASRDGSTAIHCACRLSGEKGVDTVEALLNGVPQEFVSSLVNCVGCKSGTALQIATSHPGNVEMVKLLCANGADPNLIVAESPMPPPLVLVCSIPLASSESEKRQLKVADELLARGASVNAGGSDGWTPLHCAAEVGNLALAQRLLEAGADPASVNEGKDALTFAVMNQHESLIDLLSPLTPNSDVAKIIERCRAEEDAQVIKPAEVAESDTPLDTDTTQAVESIKRDAAILVKAEEWEEAVQMYIKAIGLLKESLSARNIDKDGKHLAATLHGNLCHCILQSMPSQRETPLSEETGRSGGADGGERAGEPLLRLKEARTAAESAIALSPDWSKAYYRLSQVERLSGDLSECAQQLYMAFAKSTDDAALRKMYLSKFQETFAQAKALHDTHPAGDGAGEKARTAPTNRSNRQEQHQGTRAS